MVITDKQIAALKKLNEMGAVQNAVGAPVGVAKFGDGTTLNGNLVRTLSGLGFITTEQIDVRPYTYSGVTSNISVVKYSLTEKGKAVIA